jgi:hypothetical protein
VGDTLGLSRGGGRECQRGRRAADTPGPEEKDLGAANEQVNSMADGTLLLMYCSLYSLQRRTHVTVHLWKLIPQQVIPFNPLNYDFLPTTWKLESRNIYWATDGTHWRLLDHSQASVWYRKIKAAAGVPCFSF